MTLENINDENLFSWNNKHCHRNNTSHCAPQTHVLPSRTGDKISLNDAS